MKNMNKFKFQKIENDYRFKGEEIPLNELLNEYDFDENLLEKLKYRFSKKDWEIIAQKQKLSIDFLRHNKYELKNELKYILNNDKIKYRKKDIFNMLKIKNIDNQDDLKFNNINDIIQYEDYLDDKINKIQENISINDEKISSYIDFKDDLKNANKEISFLLGKNREYNFLSDDEKKNSIDSIEFRNKKIVNLNSIINDLRKENEELRKWLSEYEKLKEDNSDIKNSVIKTLSKDDEKNYMKDDKKLSNLFNITEKQEKLAQEAGFKSVEDSLSKNPEKLYAYEKLNEKIVLNIVQNNKDKVIFEDLYTQKINLTNGLFYVDINEQQNFHEYEEDFIFESDFEKDWETETIEGWYNPFEEIVENSKNTTENEKIEEQISINTLIEDIPKMNKEELSLLFLEIYDKNENEFKNIEKLKDIQLSILKNENVSPEIIKVIALCNDNNLSIRTEIAKNDQTPVSILEKISEDKNFFIRKTVAENKNLPIPVLEKLTKDENVLVNYEASNIIKYRKDNNYIDDINKVIQEIKEVKLLPNNNFIEVEVENSNDKFIENKTSKKRIRQ